MVSQICEIEVVLKKSGVFILTKFLGIVWIWTRDHSNVEQALYDCAIQPLPQKLQYSVCAHCQSCTVLINKTHFPAPLGKGWHTTGTDVFRGRREIEHKSRYIHPPATYFGLHTFSAYNLPTIRRCCAFAQSKICRASVLN